jgi:pimeloyl-ACP methyl ester carboxylesterase
MEGRTVMSENTLLRAGLAESKAGNTEEAARIFARLVKENPTSEQGWLALGFCCSDKKQREYCFRRVLAINPGNTQARHELELTPSPTNEAQSTAIPQRSPELATKQRSPENKSKQPISNSLPKNQSLAEKKESVSPQIIPSMKIIQNQAFEKKAGEKLAELVLDSNEPILKESILSGPKPERKKKIKARKFILLFSVIPLLLCIAALAYLYFSGTITTWLETRQHLLLAQIQSPIPATIDTQIKTTQPASTVPPTYTPSRMPSPTSAPPTFTPIPTMAPTIVYTPVFTKGACQFSPPDGVDVTCGYVTVPEDRADDQSKNIQLAVVIFHSTNPAPAPDPVVFLQGGPGGAAVLLSANNYDALVKPFLSSRDYIAFDQRGTGISIPALGCDELEKVYKQDLGGQIPATSRNYIYTNAFHSCRSAMTVSGIHLNSYTTPASSNDLRDIVTALGYQQVNLFSASYGTRLALVTIRDHPEIVRSAVLDSVVPVEVKLFNEDPIRYESSLEAMFTSCAANSQCNAAYPNLRTVFWDLVDQLDAKPVAVTAPLPVGDSTQNVNGSDLIGMTLSLLKTTQLIPYAPKIIYDIKAGDYSTFVSMQASLPYEFNGINIGLYISMMCHEHVLATTPEDLQAALDAHHDLGKKFRMPFFGDAQTMFDTCEVWGAIPPTSDENAAVISDIPALIIEGKFDPATPPIFGKQVAANLSNSYYMEFQNQGHTPTAADESGCAFGTMLTFFNTPEQEPDMTCLSSLGGVDFIVP